MLPGNFNEFQNDLYGFLDKVLGYQPLQADVHERAGHIWRHIKNLNGEDKDRTIESVQTALQSLYSKLQSTESRPLDATITTEKQELSQKIEVLRTVLFGTKLKDIPSYKRFQLMMELANRFAKNLVEHPEKSCKQVKFTLDHQEYTAWQLPEHYLLLGCADSPQGVGTFSDALVHSQYNETLCISAINETAGYFMEEDKVFLVMHVDPRQVIHTQEQDIRSPRYSENELEARTQWYDTARRMMTISGEIDTADRALGALYNYGGVHKGMPYTDLDSFNRLLALTETMNASYSDNIKELISEYRENPSPTLLKSLYEAIDRSRLALHSLDAVDSAVDDRVFLNIVESVGVEIDHKLSPYDILQTMLLLDEQQEVQARCLLRELKTILAPPAYERVEKAIQEKWIQKRVDQAVDAARTLQENHDRNTLVASFHALDKLIKSAGIESALTDRQKQLVLSLTESTYLELLTLIQNSPPSDARSWAADLGLLAEYSNDDQFMQQAKEELNKVRARVNPTLTLEDHIAAFQNGQIQVKTQNVEEVVTQLIAQEKDAAVQSALQNFKEKLAYINTESRFRMSEKDKKAFEATTAEYRQTGNRINTALYRISILKELEELPTDENRELIAKVLRGELPPLTDEQKAKELGDEIESFTTLEDDSAIFTALLQGKEVVGAITPEILKNQSGFINRPQLRLLELIHTLAPLYSQPTVEPYKLLFPKIASRLEDLERGEMTASDEYKDLIAQKEYLSKMLEPKMMFTMLFPATARQMDEEEKMLDPNSPEHQALVNARQDVMGKLRSLHQELLQIPHTFEGEDSQQYKPIEFGTRPESLRSPHEIASQTSAALSEEGLNWNEINIDLEASGGKAGGVYPTALLISQKVLDNFMQLEQFGVASSSDLKKALDYATSHSLPIFYRT